MHVDDTPEPSYVALQKAFDAVPLPPDAQPAAGTDGHLTVYQPTTDSLWEFWQLHPEADGFHASWGGAMNHVSRSPGYYTQDSYPGSTSQWGSTATSLPVIGGTIMVSELASGENRPRARAQHPRCASGASSPSRLSAPMEPADPSCFPKGPECGWTRTWTWTPST